MAFLIAKILENWSRVFPNGKREHCINFVNRSESIQKGVWISCDLDSTQDGGIRIKLEISFNKIFIEIYDAETNQLRSVEFILKKKSWLIKDRPGSGFGVLLALGDWIVSYEEVDVFFASDFRIWSADVDAASDCASENEYFAEGFSFEVRYQHTVEFERTRRKEDIDILVRVVSPYEMWPMTLRTSFELFVMIFWVNFPKRSKCNGRDRWACVNCYISLIKEIWNIPELPKKDPFGMVLIKKNADGPMDNSVNCEYID
jgi:hypothetical protein